MRKSSEVAGVVSNLLFFVSVKHSLLLGRLVVTETGDTAAVVLLLRLSHLWLASFVANGHLALLDEGSVLGGRSVYGVLGLKLVFLNLVVQLE